MGSFGSVLPETFLRLPVSFQDGTNAFKAMFLSDRLC